MDEKITNTLNELKTSFENKLSEYNSQVEDTGKAQKETRDDLKALGNQLEEIQKDLLDVQQKSVVASDSKMNAKNESFADQFLASSQFLDFQNSRIPQANMTFQNNITSSDFNTRTEAGLMVPNRKPTILDFITKGRVDGSAVHYFKRSVASTADAQNGEGTAQHSSALDFADATESVKTISSLVNISEQSLMDVAMLQSYVENELRDGLRLEKESQIIVGTGLNGQLSGLTLGANSTATVVTGISVGNIVDVCLKIISDIGKSGGNPSYLLTTHDVAYQLQSQTDAENRVMNSVTIDNQGQVRVFGVPVVASSSAPADKIVGVSERSSVLFEKMDTNISMSNSDGTNFSKGLITMRASERAALVVPYPAQVRVADLSTLAP